MKVMPSLNHLRDSSWLSQSHSIPTVDAQCLDAAGACLDAIVSDRLEAGSALARGLGLGFAAKTACATQRSVAQGLVWTMIEIAFK